MANPTIIPKKSTVAGKIPTTTDLALGEICVNHADSCIWTRHPSTGAIYKLASSSTAPASDRIWVFDQIGLQLYLGFLLYTDAPATGSIYDATAWEIHRTTTDAGGAITAEATATGAWSARTSLSYS